MNIDVPRYQPMISYVLLLLLTIEIIMVQVKGVNNELQIDGLWIVCAPYTAVFVCIQYIIAYRRCSESDRWCGGLQIDEGCCIVALQSMSIIKKMTVNSQPL